jgi:hypothetical protein
MNLVVVVSNDPGIITVSVSRCLSINSAVVWLVSTERMYIVVGVSYIRETGVLMYPSPSRHAQ